MSALPSDLNSPGVLVYSGVEGGEECAVLIRLALPNRAPTVELIIGQPQYGQPSVTSLPYIMQLGR